MGFFREPPQPDSPHPRRVPRLAGALTADQLARVFDGCVDFCRRPVAIGSGGLVGELVYLAGMVRMERVSDYILKPLAEDESLGEGEAAAVKRRLVDGAAYNLTVFERVSLDQGASDLIIGCSLLFLPDVSGCLSFMTGTEEKRGISPPPNEGAIKGARDCFVENLMTNLSLVRRHLRCPELRAVQETVGRQSLTPVYVLWVEGIADAERVAELQKRLENIDIDALLATGNLEDYVADQMNTPFPLVQYTERPDRFCHGLVQGRVGILAEGLPLGYLAPAVLGDFLSTPQDRSQNWMVSSVLTAMRWICLLVTLFLPALYVAMVNFHPEMIPTRLALSILAARRDVPVSTLFEVLLLLLAFEVLQEAGLRLPASIGQTVSILGGLVVGSAAVEAKLISPAVLVMVAAAGIAGYTMPSQDLAGALRLWRFLLTVLAGLAGLPGVTVGAVLLVGHLAGLESLGAAYLAPFAAGDAQEGERVLQPPLQEEKLRPGHLSSRNRRKQR